MKQTDQSTPIAIIGIGCLFPKADGLESFWSNIRRKVDAVTDVPETHWRPEDYFSEDPKDPDKTYAMRGAFLEAVDFDPMEFGIAPKDIEATDTAQLLGLVAAKSALQDAGYWPQERFQGQRVSCLMGVTGTLELVIPLGARLGHPLWRRALREAGVDEATADDVVRRIGESYVPWQENSFPGLLGNVVAGRIANRLDLNGANCVVDAACASSLSALHMACMELITGRSDMVLTGGIDTFNDVFMYMCFSKTPALSPSGDVRPFDRKADGTILGEGLGVVVVKRLEDAERDGDRIYAVIRSIGSSSDGSGNAVYAPCADGQGSAVRHAFEQAGVTPDTVELVEAHGTGTKVGDATEIAGLKSVFGEAETEDRPWCALGSVKSMLGHTKAAAGAAGLIKATMALHHKVLPPTIKVEEPAEPLTEPDTPLYVNTEPRPWLSRRDHPRRAGVSAFGFGGSNFHCLLEEYQPQRPGPEWDGRTQIVAFSAGSPDGLRQAVSEFPRPDKWDAFCASAAQSRLDYDGSLPHRLLLVAVRDETEPADLLDRALQLLDDQGADASWASPDGVFYGVGDPDGTLGFLFPGQGSQYVGMLRDLACQFPEFLDALAEADRVFADDKEAPRGQRLSDFIYPHSVFTEEDKRAREAALTDTKVAQPAIGAVSFGALQVLESFGVQADAAAGHSFGELTALCAAQRFSAASLHALSRLRGQLMSEGGGDKGAMLAVRAPLETVEQVIGEAGIDLIIANRNAPNQAVLSGATAEIERAAATFDEHSIANTRLPVSAAFHSAMVAYASEPFHKALEHVEFGEARLPVFANTTAQEYPASREEAIALLANQLAEPVEFVTQIRNMHARGVRTFVEVGPGARLTRLVHDILGEEPHTAIAVDASSGRRPGTADLARVLAQLAALGHKVDLVRWEDSERRAVVTEHPSRPGLSLPICGANYFPGKKHGLTEEEKSSLPEPQPRSAPEEPAAPPAPPGPATKAAPTPGPVPAPSPTPAPPPVPATAVTAHSEGVAALLRMQEQTAQLHRQFLESQETAQQALLALLGRGAAPAGTPVAAPAAPATHAPAEAPAAPSAAPEPPPSVPAAHATAAAPEPAPAPPSAAETALTQGLLNIVAEKTGYPADMLDLDMELDADLGVDSIKRVEILAAFQTEFPDLPAIGSEHLGEMRTLRDVIDLVAAESSVAPAPLPSGPVAPAPAGPAVAETLLAVVAEKTGYPPEMLELDMELDADLGIDSIKRVEILSALETQVESMPEIRPEHLGEFRTLRDVVDYIGGAAAAPTTLASAPGSGPDEATASQKLLDVVAAKTGYPPEMLELDMELDADLGIDSIKRVEILSALESELPNLPEIRPENLGEFRTLRDVVDFLSVSSAPAAAPPSAAPAMVADEVAALLVKVVADKTGYPSEMLDLDMELDADLGIDSIKRVEIFSALESVLPQGPEVRPEHLGAFSTLRDVVAFLTENGSSAPPAVAAEAVSPAPAVGADGELICHDVLAVPLDESAGRPRISLCPDGEVWVAGDCELGERLAAALEQQHGVTARWVDLDSTADLPGRSAGLVIVAPPAADDEFVLRAFGWMQRLGPGLREGGRNGGALLATVARLDGGFGLVSGSSVDHPAAGALAGLVKTARREWPEVHGRALDLDARVADLEAAIQALVDEVTMAEPVEVGIADDGPRALVLAPHDRESDGEAVLDPGDLVIISGGGRGVTAAVAAALAEAFQPTVVLLGRSPAPAPEPDWLAELETEAEIKQQLVARATDKLTPRQVNDECRRLMAARELRATLSRLERAGVQHAYRSVDVRDAAAVQSVVDELRQEWGPVRGLVHGAGVLADRRIEDKTDEQFIAVYDTKVGGLDNLLGAVGEDELRALVTFSSSTARYGRVGQVDYAAANEALNKRAQQEARRRPGCRVLSVNWGPWDGGMVTPELARVFAAEGVGLIPLSAGAEFVVSELRRPAGSPVEVVVLGPGSQVDEQQAPAAPTPAPPPAPLRPAFQRTISVERTPILADHVMNGRAVAPMALMTEWLIHGALHANPGFSFVGFDDLRLFKGITLSASEECVLEIRAAQAVPEQHGFRVAVEIRGADSDVLHAGAQVLLAETLPEAPTPGSEPQVNPHPVTPADAYARQLLFHGAGLQGIERIEGSSAAGIIAHLAAAPAPEAWTKDPLRSEWLTDPLVLDCAFQTMILWSWEHRGAASLPCFAGRYRQYRRSFPRDGIRLSVSVTTADAHRAKADMEFADAEGRLVARLEGYECVIDPALAEAFQRNRLPADGGDAATD